MPRVLLFVAVAFGITAGITHGDTFAADREEELISQGVEKRRNQDDAAALVLFQRAYAVGHSPRAAAQMGLAEVALGRWVDAKIHLDEALADSTDRWIAKHKLPLQESLARVQQHVGSLEVLGEPVGAQITVEGLMVGILPLNHPIVVRSGECRVVVKAPGYEPIARSVEVPPGQLTRETINLARIAVSASATPAPGSAADLSAAPTPAPQVAADHQQALAHPSGGSSLRSLAIVLGSAGLLGVGVGAYFGWRTYAAGNNDTNSPVFNPDAESAGRRYQTLQYVGYGVGAALLAAGATVFVIDIGRAAETTTTALVFSPTAGGPVAGLRGRF